MSDLTCFLGPYLIGNLLNYGLMGVLVVQVYFFTISFPKDRAALKVLVYLVLFVEVVQTCLSTYYAWDILVVGWGNVPHIAKPNWSVRTHPPLAGSVSFLVQSFFAWRIWVLGTRRWVYLMIVSAIVLVDFISFIYHVILLCHPAGR